MSALVSLGSNIALILALTFLYEFIYPVIVRFSRLMMSITNGVLFGSFAIIAMTQPIMVEPGVFYDSRNVVIAIAALFGGPVSALIAGVMAAMYRILVGGSGTVAGVGVIFTSVLFCVLAQRFFPRDPKWRYSNLQLALVGIVLSLIGGLWTMLLFGIDFAALIHTLPNTLIAYPLGMLLLGNLLMTQRRHRETEQALRLSERRFRAIFDSSSQHMSLLKPEGVVLEINQRALGAGKLQIDKVIGSYFWDCFPLMTAESKEELRDAIRRAAQGEIVRYEVDDWIPDGLIFDFTLTPIIDDSGEVVMLIPESREITERKMTELALRESERRYRALFDSAYEFIGLMKPDGTLLQVNRTMLDFYNLSHDEVIGRRMWDVLPTESVEVKARLRKAVAQAAEGEFIRYEAELANAEHRIIVDFSLTPILDEHGAVVLLLPEGHDITERKQFEKQQMELVLERERSSLLKKFVSDISHDFRTPLSVIRLNLDLLQRTKDPAQQEMRIRRLQQEEQHLVRLLDDMTMMLQLDDSEATLRFAPLDVNELMRGLVDDQQKKLVEKNLKMVTNFHPSELIIKGASDGLHRALSNLVVNAINYTPKDGTVNVSTRSDHNGVIVEVRDNGIGIADSDLPHIFQRFYRADSARSVDTGGTGLGLTITKRIVELHGGTIEVESVFGKGSLFRVRFPQMKTFGYGDKKSTYSDRVNSFSA